MKKHLLNIVCYTLITASLIVITRSLLSKPKKQNQRTWQYEEVTKSNDPLTEVDFDETLIDVGTISNDTTIYQSYTLRNTGAHPLIVYQVSPDCNCTNYEISKGIAMPNDSIIILLTVDTQGKHVGKFMLNTVLQVNTQRQLYRLRLVGDIVKR